MTQHLKTFRVLIDKFMQPNVDEMDYSIFLEQRSPHNGIAKSISTTYLPNSNYMLITVLFDVS